MATSSAFSTDNTYIKYKITVVTNSRNVANNTSNVTVSVNFYRTNTGYTTYGTGTVYCKINGTTYSASVTSDDKITSSGIVLFSKTLNITHNADGTKTLATSAWISHERVSSSEQSYSVKLTTIPRATTPTLSATSVNMGSSITITMDRASSSFTHNVYYTFGDVTGTIGTGLGTSKEWTVPLTLANEIPNATSGTITLNCKTYNGSTLIGTKQVSFTAKVPSSVVPAISSVDISEAVSGLADKFGVYIKDNSKLAVSISASGSYSSTITTYKTTILSKNYYGSSFTSGLLTSSGTVSIKTTITDSRGRTATTTKSVSVSAYTPPMINSLVCYRSDSDGTQNDEGTYLTANVNFSITSLSSKNDKTYVLAYKTKDATSYTTLVSGSVYEFDNAITSSSAILDANTSYDIRLAVTDYFDEVYAYFDVGTAFTLLDFNASGKGVAIGKVSEKDAFEVALPIKSSNAEMIGSPKSLTGTVDLDDITTPGFYNFTVSVSNNLVNSPFTGNTGTLTVIAADNTGRLIQSMSRCAVSDYEIWERRYLQGAWQSWVKVYNGKGKILWNDALYVTASQTVTLSEAISKQANGIVLLFSRYDPEGKEAQDYNFTSHFVHKKVVELFPGKGHCFLMSNAALFLYFGAKYLYINDETITGSEDNRSTGTSTTSGITYANNQFVLRYVIGV